MADAAHAGLLEHEIFSKPFKVEPQFEYYKTPGNYFDRHLGTDKLPDKMKVWLVQKTGKRYGSVVARSYGFTDSPDAETLILGFNAGKEYGAVGIGRHGNFLQWGYWAPPSQMTEAGRKLFLNCICYIHKFDGKPPLIRRVSSHRWNAIRLAALINRIKDDRFFSSTFPSELKKKYEGDPNGLVKYYRDDFEFIYRDKVFLIDKELKSLGLKSNRETETLERLISFLEDEKHADTARLLLARYTSESFQTAEQWRSWFRDNKDRFFFSDVGGFKFFVVPKGYMEYNTQTAVKEKQDNG
jgi:hypothetical protein